MPQQHLILSTHTTLHLASCLQGAALQSRRPDSVTLSCDVVSPEIVDVCREFSGETNVDVLVVQRPHTGKARCSQVRNNGVRALRLHAASSIADDARLIFLDGDTVLSRDAVALHDQLGGPRGLMSVYRVNLSQAQTDAFEFAALADGREPVGLSDDQRADIATRQRRYKRQLLMRKLGLGKAHKPRLIGGHFSVPLAAYLDVNGCDEAYEGYGQEDDDFARRLHRAGWPSVVAVDRVMVYHLYHPTRAPAAWDTAPGVVRFRERTPTRAALGLDAPAAQGQVEVVRCSRGSVTPLARA